MDNGKSELQNYVLTIRCNNAKAANRKMRTTKLRNSRTIDIIPFGPEFCPQESYAAVQNCVLPGSVPPPKAALVRALP